MRTSPFRSCFLIFLSTALIMVSGTGCTKELRKARHLSRGNREFEAHRYEQAEIEYLNVLKAAPLNPVAIRQLGIIYQEQGNLPKARMFLIKAVELEPENLDARLKLAMNALSVGDFKQALEQANWVLAKKPGQLEALEVLAGSATNSAAIQPLTQQIEKLRKADTDRASYHVALGDLGLRSGDVTNAETEFKQALALDPKCSAAFGGLGTLYWARKDLPAAEQAFKSASELSPVRSFRRLKYAEFQLVTGKTEDGKRTLDQITKEAPDYLPVWDYLAQLAYSERRYDDCRTIVQRVLGKDPANYDALMLNGSVQLAKGDAAKAISEFSRMATIYVRSPQVQFQLARAYLMTNETAKATVCLQKAVAADKNFVDAVVMLADLNIRKGDADQAIAPLTELIKRQPQLSQAYLLLADAYLVKKDLDQSVAVCRSMAEVFPKSPEVPMLIGALYVRQDKLEQARSEFEKALELSPGYFSAIKQLVNLDIKQQKYAEAIARVQSLVDKQPKAAEPWILMAGIHLAQAQGYVEAENKNRPSSSGPKLRLADVPAAQPEVSKAEAALQKAIDLNPDLQEPFLMLADLSVAAGKQQQALDRLNSLISKTNDVALIQVGRIQDGLKNYPAARDAYEKVPSSSRLSGAALNNLAYLYAERFNDLDKGLQMAEKARQLLPNDPSTADTLGWVLYRRGEYARALGLLEESASKLPDQSEIHFHVGMTQYMLGNEGAARLTLQKAVEGTQQYDGKDQASRRLALLAIDPKTADAAAVSELQKQLQETPSDTIALERMGAIQERDGAFDKAANTYETALKINPQDASLTAKLAQLYATRLNDPQKALTFAKSAHDLAPDDARISALLGRLVFRTGDFKWATSLLEDSARKLPSDPQVAFDLSWAYYSVGGVSEAQNLMQTAAKAGAGFPKSDDAKRFVSIVNAAKDPASAAAALPEAQKVIATDTNYVPALMILAIGQEGQGNYQRAVELYNQVLSQFPTFTPASRNLGLIYFAHIPDDQKAYDLITKAREAFPQDPEVAKALGILNYRKGNYTRAVQLLKESGQSLKQDAELHYYLGKAQYQLKSKSESKASLQRALDFNLPTKLAEDAKKVLLELK